MKQLIFLIVAVVLAIAATVLAFIFIVPEKRREKLNAFGKSLRRAPAVQCPEGLLDRRKQMDGRHRPAVHHCGPHCHSPQL